MFVDSHCHLDFPDFHGREQEFVERMKENQVAMALIAGVTLERFPQVLALVERFPLFVAAVGVHPDTEGDALEPDVETLLKLSSHPQVVAIGETGLDYYRLNGDLEWQRERFRTHIRAAKATSKPLIIHTRQAAEDTLRLLQEEGAGEVGGVFHCFTEDCEVARKALNLGFHISLSGIVTFKKALQIKEVARFVPIDRLLIETDSPYLAPVPFRGKLNHPALVKHVAEEVSILRGVSVEDVGRSTTENFYRLFKIKKHA